MHERSFVKHKSWTSLNFLFKLSTFYLASILFTVFIQLTALGAYEIFGPWEWALIQGGRLFEAGRLLNFHHFQQG